MTFIIREVVTGEIAGDGKKYLAIFYNLNDRRYTTEDLFPMNSEHYAQSFEQYSQNSEHFRPTAMFSIQYVKKQIHETSF